MMDKYRVIIPWFGVKKGDIIETDKLHPALLPNVEVVEDRKLEVATPVKTEPRKDEKK